MPQYLKLGSIPRKRHIAHRHEPGFRGEGIAYEEVVTAAGFNRAYSIVYHLRPPTRVSSLPAAWKICCGVISFEATRSRSRAIRRPGALR